MACKRVAPVRYQAGHFADALLLHKTDGIRKALVATPARAAPLRLISPSAKSRLLISHPSRIRV